MGLDQGQGAESSVQDDAPGAQTGPREFLGDIIEDHLGHVPTGSSRLASVPLRFHRLDEHAFVGGVGAELTRSSASSLRDAH